MSESLDDLLTPLTADEVLETELAEADALELATTTWLPGDPTRTMLAVVAHTVAPWTSTIARATAGGLLDYATAGWLTLLARNGFGIKRIAATYASGDVTLTNAGGGVYTFAAGDLIVSNSATGASYRNTAAGTLNALGTLTLAVLAQEPGSDSTSAPAAIDTISAPAIGSSVTVANATALVGADTEADAALRQRCRDSLAALSPDGAAAAYAYIARSALRVDGTAIGVTRVSVRSTSGQVFVYLADPDGAPEAADVTRIDDLLQTQVVPVSVTCTTAAAVEQTIAVTYIAFVPSTTTDSDDTIKAAISAALVAYFAELPIGGSRSTPLGSAYVFADLIRGIIARSHAAIFHTTLAAPAADVLLVSDKVAVLGTITATVTRVAQVAS